MAGIEEIASERRKQIQEKEYTLEHDLKINSDIELIKVTFCLLGSIIGINKLLTLPFWPNSWNMNYFDKWSSQDRINILKKAGAFIAAQIDVEKNKK